jgi:metallo-beta-lactamase family protein
MPSDAGDDRIRLSFHGATRTVTGSCHLVEAQGVRILVDCGMFQGGRELKESNEEPFGFDPASIDYLLLTHAHLDHCGRIPLLVKRGFEGEIIATAATQELARVVMMDSAHLHEEEAQRRARYLERKHGRHHGHKADEEEDTEPLYTHLDALNAMGLFGRKATYREQLEVAPGIRATFYDAGHILGSALILLEIRKGDGTRRILFSGDLGNPGHPILNDPTPAPEADWVVMETTYGDRVHRSIEESTEELYDAVSGTIEAGGNVLIPTFAIERAQEVLYALRRATESGRLPPSLPIFLDSPMAISATEIFRRHPECYDEAAAQLFAEGEDPFATPGLVFTRSTEDSKALNRFVGGAVILAGSGMCTGGRIRHHLGNNLWRAETAVVFVGFAARGTLARQIIDGARHVRIFGEDIAVRSRIYSINGFSAHADRNELLEWLGHAGHPSRVVLVHGEPEGGMGAMARTLKELGHHVLEPELHQAFDVD